MNNNFENLYFDYFTNSPSYVKVVLDLLPNNEEINRNKDLVKTLYNYVMNNVNDDKRMEILYVSSMFNNQISLSPKEDVYKQVDYIYNNFLKRMIYDSINREKIFDIMNECVKLYTGFYSEYQNIRVSSVDGVKIEKGNYR